MIVTVKIMFTSQLFFPLQHKLLIVLFIGIVDFVIFVELLWIIYKLCAQNLGFFIFKKYFAYKK